MATEHDDLREQAGLYVLGALTRAERAAFEAHLASCAECAAEVRALSGVAGALALAVPQTDPPVELRARVLSSIGGTTVRARRVAGSGYLAWLATAAALVLAVALGAYAAQLRGRIGALEVRLRDAMLRADAGERQIADARRAAAGAESKVAVLAAPDLQRIDLEGQPAAPRASARAYWSRSRGLVFTASDLPALPPGRVYQLWVLSAQPAPISAGVLPRPDASGRVDALIPTPVDLPKPTAMAVTIEPDGGVSAPSGDKYLIGAAPATF